MEKEEIQKTERLVQDFFQSCYNQAEQEKKAKSKDKEWVSVHDITPEGGYFYLVYDLTSGAIVKALYEDGWHLTEDFLNPNISHWQQLPTPPKP